MSPDAPPRFASLSTHALRFLRAYDAHSWGERFEVLSLAPRGEPGAWLALRVPAEGGGRSDAVMIVDWDGRSGFGKEVHRFVGAGPVAVHNLQGKARGFVVVTARTASAFSVNERGTEPLQTLAFPVGETVDLQTLQYDPDRNRCLWTDASALTYLTGSGVRWTAPLAGLAALYEDVVFCAGHKLVAGARTAYVALYDCDTGTQIFSNTAPGMETVTALELVRANDVPTLALIAWGDTLECWDEERFETRWRVSYLQPIRSIRATVDEFTKQSDAVIVGESGSSWTVDYARGRTGTTYDPTWPTARAWWVSDDWGLFRLRERSLERADLQTGETLARHPLRHAKVTRLAWSPDGSRLASASEDHTLRVWNALTLESVWNFESHPAVARDVCFSPDGHLLLARTNEGQIRVWDLHSGIERSPWAPHPHGPAVSLALSPDGSHAVCVQAFNTAVQRCLITVWDVWRGAVVEEFSSRSQRPPPVSFGDLPDRFLRLEEVVSGQQTASWMVFAERFRCGEVRFEEATSYPQLLGPFMVFETSEFAKLHDLRTGDYRGCVALSGSPSPETSSHCLFAATAQYVVELFGDLVRVLPVTPELSPPVVTIDLGPFEDAPTCAAFSPDGRTLAVGTCQGYVLLFAFSP